MITERQHEIMVEAMCSAIVGAASKVLAELPERVMPFLVDTLVSAVAMLNARISVENGPESTTEGR